MHGLKRSWFIAAIQYIQYLCLTRDLDKSGHDSTVDMEHANDVLTLFVPHLAVD
jgi:hypothetical protein